MHSLDGHEPGSGDMTSPRAASLLFARALQRVDRIQPPGIRAPVVAMLEAGVERCAVVTSLLGQPVNHLIALAEALTAEGES